MNGNLAWLIYFCNKTYPISAQKNICSLLHKNFFCQEFGHILARKKYDYLKTILELMTQNKFDINWKYVLKLESL